MSRGLTPEPPLGDTAERDIRVGPTAHYTAYAWFVLGMPYAEWFKTQQGARLFWSLRLGVEWVTRVARGVPRLIDYLELRHRCIDHTLRRLDPDRVIELGAGLSRRGVTWALDHGVHYVEVDLPHMTQAKRRLVLRFPKAIRSTLDERLKLVSADVLSPEFETWLAAELEGSRRPVVIAEGLLGYFDESERQRLASAIAGALRRSRVQRYSASFLCDLRVKSKTSKTRVAVKALRAAITVATRGRGAREDFDSEDAIYHLFAGAGFDAARPIDPEQVPDLGRADDFEAFPMRVWHFTLTPSGSS
ncbi:MAG: class I SAM-dependent methyltransferase [Myxococcales bacterium]|nr:class I SAM-dependent methyltransferase [Myxococcales bacterium]